jgi:predicted nucleic acid-binding protein
MVLVDTSIWVRFLHNRGTSARELRSLLEANVVCGHDLVFGELFIGDPSGRLKLLDLYPKFHQSPTLPHPDIVDFARHRRLHGRGAGWIDIHLVASALASGHQFWTADSDLHIIARELGIAYEPSA